MLENRERSRDSERIGYGGCESMSRTPPELAIFALCAIAHPDLCHVALSFWTHLSRLMLHEHNY